MSYDLNEHARKLSAIRDSEDWHTRSIERGSWRVKYERRTSKAVMGRFGGGWQWELGARLGGGTLIVSVLVASVRIDWRRS